jgi:hypothetical protein
VSDELWEGAYHLFYAKDPLSIAGELMLDDTDFPAPCIPAQFSTKGTTDNLVAEADTDDTDTATLETALGELDEAHNPLIVIECIVLRTRDQNSVDGFRVRVGSEIVDDVMRGKGQLGFQRHRMRIRCAGPLEHVGEHATIRLVFGLDGGDWGISLEDGKPDWRIRIEGTHGCVSGASGASISALNDDVVYDDGGH